MKTRLDTFTIAVDGEGLSGTLLQPVTDYPGVLFVHGWGGSQQHDLVRAREAAALGCACLTFDLRGHEATARQRKTVSRAHNLADLLAAYDWFVAQRHVDASSIAVVGISYGGYLATLLSELRPVRWLALRAPALYKDEDWALPKHQLNLDPGLQGWRRTTLAPQDNRALRACAAFRGDVLLVASEHDEIIPGAVVDNYRAACLRARSLTVRAIAGADHALSTKPMRHAYTTLLLNWLSEMIAGARTDAVAEAHPEGG